MKKILVLCAIFITNITLADTINVNWMVGDSVYDTTTCTVGDDLILPTAPTKRGHTFVGWQPKQYVYLEYIESTGTQYIDTGIDMTDDVEFTATVAVSRGNVGGIRVTNTELVVWQAGSYFNFRYLNNNGIIITQPIDAPFNLRVFYNVGYNINKTTFIVDNVSISKSNTINSGIGTIRTGRYDLTASLKIYNKGVKVRDFSPVRRVKDNAIGLYDTVTDTFFTNAGAGEFIAGPEL